MEKKKKKDAKNIYSISFCLFVRDNTDPLEIVVRDKRRRRLLFVFFADEHEQVSPVEDEDDEVRKLKVCIELKGLRLSKPAAGAASPEGPQSKQERAWSQLALVAPGQSLRDHKTRAGESDDRAAAQRADINRKWGCEKLLNGKNEPAAISNRRRRRCLRVQLG